MPADIETFNMLRDTELDALDNHQLADELHRAAHMLESVMQYFERIRERFK
jgi:hypothetical protein